MKILFVIKTMHLAGGGAERLLVQIISGLADRRHNVSLLTFDPPGTSDFYPVDEAVRRVWIGKGPRGHRPGSLSSVMSVARLRKALLKLTPDVAVGFMHSAYFPLALARAATGIPGVGSEHIVWSHYADKPLERLSLWASALTLDAFTAVSEPARQTFPPQLRRKMTAIANAVAGADGRIADVAGRVEKVLLSVGRLEPQKDHETLIRAFSAIAPRFPDWSLRILGEGRLREQLKALTRELGVDQRVRLPGAVSDIDSEYLRAQLFAISSRYESFGLVTAEALARGLPVVGFADCPGTNELVINNETGLLVAGLDRVSALANGLALLMGSADERARMAAAAPASVSDFSVERMVERWEQLLTRVVQRRPAASEEKSVRS
ncbi:MAG: glycosyltransferase family 4 protein [Sphingomicrobium sp.]